MVKKEAKLKCRTGKTLRRKDKASNANKYGVFVNVYNDNAKDSSSGTLSAQNRSLSVQLSINKKERWNLPTHFESLLDLAATKPDYQTQINHSDGSLRYSVNFPGTRVPDAETKKSDNGRCRKHKPTYWKAILAEEAAYEFDLEYELDNFQTNSSSRRNTFVLGNFLCYDGTFTSKNASDTNLSSVVGGDIYEEDTESTSVNAGHNNCVILRNNEIDSKSLKSLFGKRFLECKTVPRRFVIDITDAVFRGFFYSKLSQCSDTICVVFIQDTFNKLNTSENTVFQVLFKGKYHKELEKKFQSINFTNTNLTELLQMVIEILNLYQTYFSSKDSTVKQKNANRTVLEETFKWSSSSYLVDDRYLMDFIFVLNTSAIYLMDEFCKIAQSKENTCRICAEECNNNMTALKKCGHGFCNSCWRTFILSRLHSGIVSFTCPDYECNVVVDPGILLSFIPFDDFRRYATWLHSRHISRQKDRLWCPNPKCGRVLCLKGDRVNSASCVCGHTVCLRCKEQSHWPADCETFKIYSEQLKGAKGMQVFDSLVYTATSLNGKPCPICNMFIEKKGGCNHVTCAACRKSFCWGCMEIWTNSMKHKDTCKNYSKDDFGTTKVILSSFCLDHLAYGEWYKFSMRHHLYQQPSKIAKLREALYSALKMTRRSFTNSNQRSIIIQETLSNKGQFVESIVNPYLETFRVIECCAVFLNSAKKYNDDIGKLQEEVRGFSRLVEDLDKRIFEIVAEKDISVDLLRHLQKTKTDTRKDLKHFIKNVTSLVYDRK